MCAGVRAGAHWFECAASGIATDTDVNVSTTMGVGTGVVVAVCPGSASAVKDDPLSFLLSRPRDALGVHLYESLHWESFGAIGWDLDCSL